MKKHKEFQIFFGNFDTITKSKCKMAPKVPKKHENKTNFLYRHKNTLEQLEI